MVRTRRLMIDIAVMIGVGLMLTLLGPFGSYGAPFGVRLVYWLMLAIGGYIVYRPAILLARHLADRIELPFAAMAVAACLIATIPMTAIVWFANAIWAGRSRPSLDNIVTLYGDVLVVGALVCALIYFLNRQPATAEVAPLAADAPKPAQPSQFPPDLIALQAEDHYLRIHQPQGSQLVLMRLGDAVAQLDGHPGMQVHRSWWVAREAVARTERDGRNVRLILSNGLSVPVARGSVGLLRDAGWI